jgi:hypothetical protein
VDIYWDDLPGAARARRRRVRRRRKRGLPRRTGVAPGRPYPGDFGEFHAVTCTSPASCWAVGYYARGSTDFRQVQRWNGRRWTPVHVPGRSNRYGAASTLTGVTCVSHASCWAVGELGGRDGSEHNQVIHWNGHKWSMVPVPDPGATATFNELLGVSCTAPTSCWAVGEHSGNLGFEHNQVVHWNGRKWSLVLVPDPGGPSSTSDSGLFGVSCAAPASCWAVGNSSPRYAAPQLNEVLHWNGRKWSRAQVPTPNGFSELFGVSCPSPDNCWAVGTVITGVNNVGYASGALNEVLHWNGRKWRLIATPDPGGTTLPATNVLNGVSCASAASCWAVGDAGYSSSNEALHWNGSRWSNR